MNVLIVKFGALGDVVRTSYFAEPLRKKWGKKLNLIWITSPTAKEVLDGNPHINSVVTDFHFLRSLQFNHIYSLDDEETIIREVSKLKTNKLSGAYMQGDARQYTDDVSLWFDMGVLSRFGLSVANRLKRENTLSHGTIFAKIFDVDAPKYSNYLATSESVTNRTGDWGLNLTAGTRWPSKSLPIDSARNLISALLSRGGFRNLVLLGGDSEVTFLKSIKEFFYDEPRVICCNTRSDVRGFASKIKLLDLLITADTFAMHLAISQAIPVIAFFTVTSAAEVDAESYIRKILMSGQDYCSYNPELKKVTVDLSDFLIAVDDFCNFKATNSEVTHVVKK